MRVVCVWQEGVCVCGVCVAGRCVCGVCGRRVCVNVCVREGGRGKHITSYFLDIFEDYGFGD